MPDARKTLWGHPKGLYILFFTELWERFSYYGMRAILVLYLTAATTGDNPGLGWENASALELYGWYTMLVYLMGVPGGWIADRWLGQKKTVMIGGLLLCAGHCILALEALWAFYLGLALIVSGVGALKPNISIMVGGLYPGRDVRRDSGFTLFYIGINIGAFLAPLLVGYLGEVVSWHYGFGLAGLGMILGQLIYIWGQRYLTGVGDSPAERVRHTEEDNKPLTREEKDRMILLFLSFLIVIVFWGAYEQAGGLMNIYAKEKIDRMVGGFEIPASYFQSLPALYVILFGGPVALMWVRIRNKNPEVASLFKMAVGTIIMGAGFLLMAGASGEADSASHGKAAIWWILGAYLLHVIGELCTSPVALSFISKLAPHKYSSFMMGAYFATTGLGNKLAGEVGEAAQKFGETAIFNGIFSFCTMFGILLLLFLKKLNKLAHDAEAVQLPGQG